LITATAALVAPYPLRPLARIGIAAYGLAVLSASVQVARRGGLRDAIGVPLVFVTMHLAWGAGFLAGCLRFGPPVRAFARMLPRPGSQRVRARLRG
jgi:DMSO reductase anchor subunit